MFFKSPFAKHVFKYFFLFYRTETTIPCKAFIFLTMLSMDSLCYYEEIIQILMSTRSNTQLITTFNLHKDEHDASITKVQMIVITSSSLTESQFFWQLSVNLQQGFCIEATSRKHQQIFNQIYKSSTCMQHSNQSFLHIVNE